MLCYLSFNSQTVNLSLNLFISALYFYFLAFRPVVSYFVELVSVYLILFLAFALYLYFLSVFCFAFSVINVHHMVCNLSFNSQTVNFSLSLFVSSLYFYFLAFHPVVSYFCIGFCLCDLFLHLLSLCTF